MTSLEQAFVALRRGMPRPLAPLVDPAQVDITEMERAMLEQLLAVSAIGTVESVRKELEGFVADTGEDELIVVSQIHDHAARLRSYQILAEACPST